MLKRGFKSWCENISLLQRKDMGLDPIDPLDPKKLAERLGVLVWNVDEVPELDPKSLQILTKGDPTSWSAATICFNGHNLIILNTTHSHARTCSNLMHELSHLIIGHEAARLDVMPENELMLRSYDKTQEDEADWLAGCLLLPRPALLHIKKNGMDHQIVRSYYGASKDMFAYRVRITGVERQFRPRR